MRIKEVHWLTPRGAGSNPVRDMVIEMRIRADGIGPRASPPLHYGINRASFKWVLRIAHHLATIVGRETRFS